MSIKKFGDPNTILNRMREAYGLGTDAELARFLGVNASTVATWRKKSSMKFDRIIESAKDLNMNWLFFGEGPLWRSGPAEIPAQAMNDPEVPFYKSIQTASDGGIISDRVESLVYVGLPLSFIREELEADPAELFLTRATGDGMEPTIADRDFILVQKNIGPPYAGRIYLVRLDDSHLCKRIHEKPGNRVVVMSDNDRYSHLEIEPGEGAFQVIGRVIWSGRRL